MAVDDGSNDASGAILDAHAGRDRRLRIVSTPHAGIGAALHPRVHRRRPAQDRPGHSRLPRPRPGALPKAGTAFIVSFARSRGAREAIEAHLRAAGYRPGVDYILAA